MKKIVFLTGAGISAESGFQTFRGQNGLWENEPIERVATHEAIMTDPNFVNAFYNKLRQKLFDAQPNDAHRCIKALEEMYEVVVITQNVDDLHEKAGSKNVVHLHGELKKVCSSAEPYNPKYIEELTIDNCNVAPDSWAKDGSRLRPFIVFFNEDVPMIQPAVQIAGQADIFVIVGTSLQVYPAASLIHYVQPNVPIYIIDPSEVSVAQEGRICHIQQGASQGMKELMALLEKQK